MARVSTIVVLVALLAGCGGNGTNSTGTTGNAEVHPASTCGVKGFRVEQHGLDCEVVNAMIVMLNGRALHQTLSLEWEHGHRATWTCNSPTRSLVDRLHCQHGSRWFTIEPVLR